MLSGSKHIFTLYMFEKSNSLKKVLLLQRVTQFSPRFNYLVYKKKKAHKQLEANSFLHTRTVVNLTIYLSILVTSLRGWVGLY